MANGTYNNPGNFQNPQFQQPPKKSNMWGIVLGVGCGCLALIPILSVIAIAVLIQLGKNVTSVFSAINSQLQVAQLSGDDSNNNH